MPACNNQPHKPAGTGESLLGVAACKIEANANSNGHANGNGHLNGIGDGEQPIDRDFGQALPLFGLNAPSHQATNGNGNGHLDHPNAVTNKSEVT